MAKYIIEESTLKGLGNALRKVTGENRTYTPTEMIQAVTTIMDAAAYILVDEDGNEIPAVFVENITEIDATANDIRLGATAITAEGVTEGTKEIPAYQTTEGYEIVKPGAALDILMFSDKCQYSKLQVIVCAYNNNQSGSVSAEMVVINNKLYAVKSTDVLSDVVVNTNEQSIKLGVTNTSDTSLLIRYMTIKEET